MSRVRVPSFALARGGPEVLDRLIFFRGRRELLRAGSALRKALRNPHVQRYDLVSEFPFRFTETASRDALEGPGTSEVEEPHDRQPRDQKA